MWSGSSSGGRRSRRSLPPKSRWLHSRRRLSRGGRLWRPQGAAWPRCKRRSSALRLGSKSAARARCASKPKVDDQNKHPCSSNIRHRYLSKSIHLDCGTSSAVRTPCNAGLLHAAPCQGAHHLGVMLWSDASWIRLLTCCVAAMHVTHVVKRRDQPHNGSREARAHTQHGNDTRWKLGTASYRPSLKGGMPSGHRNRSHGGKHLHSVARRVTPSGEWWSKASGWSVQRAACRGPRKLPGRPHRMQQLYLLDVIHVLKLTIITSSVPSI